MTKIQETAVKQIAQSKYKTVSLWYGHTFVVSGGTFHVERNTVQALVKQGILRRVNGIKETYGLADSEPQLNEVPASSTAVNRVLKQLELKERLVRGNGYWYFIDGGAAGWESSSVAVYRITAYTVEGWLEQYALLRWSSLPSWKLEYRADGKGLVIINRDYFDKKNFGTVLFTSENILAVIKFLLEATK